MPQLTIQPLLPISQTSSISLGLASPRNTNFPELRACKMVHQSNRCTQALLSVIFILMLPHNFGHAPTVIVGLISTIFSLLLVEDHMVQHVFPSGTSEPQFAGKVRFSASFILAVAWMIVGIEWLFKLLEAEQACLRSQVLFWVSLVSWMSWTLSFAEEPYLAPGQGNLYRLI